MKIIVPMAGLGTRFSKVAHLNPEYKKPKPFIRVHDTPMVRWATGSLPFIAHPDRPEDSENPVQPKDLIFIILKEHNQEHQIEKQLREIYSPAIHVIILDAVTRGAAETAYQAKDLVDPEEEIIITDSDHHFDGNYFYKIIKDRRPKTVGIIPVFKNHDGIPKWSFSLLKEGSNVILKVAEKDRALMEMGAHANIGAYYFAKAKHFFREALKVISGNKVSGEPGKTEFYIAPLYQNLIEQGYQVEAAVIPTVWNIGTPEDLDIFLKKFPNKEPR